MNSERSANASETVEDSTSVTCNWKWIVAKSGLISMVAFPLLTTKGSEGISVAIKVLREKKRRSIFSYESSWISLFS